MYRVLLVQDIDIEYTWFVGHNTFFWCNGIVIRAVLHTSKIKIIKDTFQFRVEQATEYFTLFSDVLVSHFALSYILQFAHAIYVIYVTVK